MRLSESIGAICLTGMLAASPAAQDMSNRNATSAASFGVTNAVHPPGMRLEWTRFFGGSSFENVKTRAPVLDGDGMLWFLGETASKDFPTTPDALYPKIASVPGGDFFITGSTTSKDLPVTADAVEKTMESKRAVFLARFSGDGRQLKYCTYLGGQGPDATSFAGGLVYDGRSKIYLAAGQVTSSNYPVTPDALQAKHQGRQDAVLLAFNLADNSLAYGSYLGGSKNEDMPLLAFDGNGALYVIGATDSDDFPTLEKTPGQRKGTDVFIAKFSVRNDLAGRQP